MAFLFLDRLNQNNSRLFQISVKILKLLLLSAGLISTLGMVKKAVASYSCEIVLSSLVGFWSSVRCFLSSSLSLCIIIHVMVVLIAASSTFYHHENDKQDDEITVDADDHDIQIAESFIATPPLPPAPPLSRDVFEVTPPPPSPGNVNKESAATLSSRTRISTRSITSSTLYQGSNDDVSSLVRSNSTEQNCIEKTTLSLSGESFFDELLMSAAYEIKKTAYSCNSSPKSSDPTQGKISRNILPLHGKGKEEFMENDDRVTSNLSEDKENEEEDTMEATWKAITGGKQRSKKKHLKKSETWNMPPQRSVAVQRLDSEELLPTTLKWRELRKAATFNDAVSVMRKGGLRRDPSISLEDFNHRVEVFIKSFNDKMRLERQESNQRFLNMINGGV